MKRNLGLTMLAVYVGSIVLANYLTNRYGFVSIGFGYVTTAGTVAIGGAILTRDLIQDALGRAAVLAAILVGAGVSWGVSSAHLATASGLTFLVAEGLEFAVYTPLRRRAGFATMKWSGVVSVANVVGAVADTFLFLWLAGFPLTANIVEGQIIGKLYLTAVVIAVAPVVRSAIRPSVVATT